MSKCDFVEVSDLSDNTKYLLLYELDISTIKTFLKQENKKLSVVYKFYLACLFISIGVLGFCLSSTFFNFSVGRVILFAAAIVFSFSLLIVIHELLHAVAYRLLGARKVSFGGSLKKFMFYAACNQQVFSGKQYILLALTPFVAIIVICVLGMLLLPAYWLFFITVLCFHNFFCSGDFAFINLIMQHKWRDVYTYDDLAKQKTYFYIKK